MAEKVIFIPVIVEEITECEAGIAEFGLRVTIKGYRVRKQTIECLGVLLNSYCHGNVNGDYSSSCLSDAQMRLAERVVAHGFEFKTQ